MTQWQPRPNIPAITVSLCIVCLRQRESSQHQGPTNSFFKCLRVKKIKTIQLQSFVNLGFGHALVAEAIGPDTWISSGLITLNQNQPVSIRMKATLLIFLSLGLTGLAVCRWYPKAIERSVDLLLQTQQLPPHARPLISVNRNTIQQEIKNRSTSSLFCWRKTLEPVGPGKHHSNSMIQLFWNFLG